MHNSYTNSFTRARKFHTQEEADRDRCIESEYVERIDPYNL